MTTLTLLELNPRSRRCHKDMQDMQSLHRTIMSMFPQATTQQARREFGVLWRIEPGDLPNILVQSKDQPDLGALPNDYAISKSKPIDRHLASIGDSSLLRYRVTMNPVRRSRIGGRNTETTIPFSEQGAWWNGIASRNGLMLVDEPTLIGQPVRRRTSNGTSLPVYSTQIDGTAEVGDAEAVRQVIHVGIGKAKAWGCGLLTTARLT